MEFIRFTLDSNNEIWDFIDNSAEYILIHDFYPHDTIEWWESTIKISPNIILENIKVRNLRFDIQTNITGLKQIIDLNNNFIEIYQFTKPIPNAFEINRLPKNNAEKILVENGLQYIIDIQFESITVSSIHPEFIKNIAKNPLFADRIQYNSIDK